MERKKSKPEPSLDRLPPHSPESEQGVLGCILCSPDECIQVCIERLKGCKDAFYDLRHQEIFDAFMHLFADHKPIDAISVTEYLRAREKLDGCGGIAYIASLPDSTPSAANLSYYLDSLVEQHQLREIIRCCCAAVAQIYDFPAEPLSVLGSLERQLGAIRDGNANFELKEMKPLIHEAMNEIEQAVSGKGVVSGIETGFSDFDKMTAGLHKGDMIVMAGRPSTGKTSLAMNIVEHVSCDMGKPVGVFSLEMTAVSLALRLLSSRAKINLHSIRDGFLAERDFQKLTMAAGQLAKAPVYLDDRIGLQIIQMSAVARMMVLQKKVELIVIDYLQLMAPVPSKGRDNREQQVSQMAYGVKVIARDLGVPVIVLSQLNRDSEREKRRPRLSDLRESGGIENHADAVVLLHKANENGEPATPEDDVRRIELYIAKQRNGPCGMVPLTFMNMFTRFESAAKIVEDDLPSHPYND